MDVTPAQTMRINQALRTLAQWVEAMDFDDRSSLADAIRALADQVSLLTAPRPSEPQKETS